MKVRLIIIGLMVLLILGCSNNNCPLESSVYCNFAFYDSEGTPAISNDTIDIYVRRHIKGDSIVVNKLTGKNTFRIPMSYYGTSDTIIFDYASLIRNDTLILNHESYPHIDLPECGTKYFHTLKDVYLLNSGASIDDVEIENPEVNYQGNENIKIYLNGVVQ